jgi:hypothetical protein
METGEELRDEGVAQVEQTNNMWFIRAMQVYNEWAKQNVGVAITGESIRMLISTFVPPPKHPNAWGAFVMHLIKRERLKPTGDLVRMVMPKSHARLTRLYEVIS